MSVYLAKKKSFLAYQYTLDKPRHLPGILWRVGLAGRLSKSCILESLVENPNNLILRSNMWPLWPKLDELLNLKSYSYIIVRFRHHKLRVVAIGLADFSTEWKVELGMTIEYEDRTWHFDCNIISGGRGVVREKLTPKETLEFYKAVRSGKAKITMELSFRGFELIPSVGIPFQPNPTTSFARKLLEDQIKYDVQLVALNGVRFPCHKGFLAGHCAWFQHLFKTRPEEKIWKFRMTEEGLGAFLKYIYYADIEDPKKDLKIGIELLKIGRKYKIFSMEKGMMDLLLEEVTMSVEIALELFCFTRKEKGLEMLKMRAIELMKWNSVKVSESETLQSILGKEDLDARKELDLIGLC